MQLSPADADCVRVHVLPELRHDPEPDEQAGDQCVQDRSKYRLSAVYSFYDHYHGLHLLGSVRGVYGVYGAWRRKICEEDAGGRKK